MRMGNENSCITARSVGFEKSGLRSWHALRPTTQGIAGVSAAEEITLAVGHPNGTTDTADPTSAPRKRLIALLDYIEQVEKLNRKPAFVVPATYFSRYENDARGLPSLEFDVGGEGDEIWLRVAR